MNFNLSLKELDFSRWDVDFSMLNQLVDAVFYTSFAIFAVKRFDSQDSRSLVEIAQDVESFVAGYLQNDHNLLIDVFGDLDVRWDMYVVILVSGEIDIEARIKLENDRLFCKKIILPYNPEVELADHLQHTPLFFNWGGTLHREGDYFTKEEFLHHLCREMPAKKASFELQSFIERVDLEDTELNMLIRKHFDFGR